AALPPPTAPPGGAPPAPAPPPPPRPPGPPPPPRAAPRLDLTKTEFDLLELLLRNQGTVLTRHQIYERIWGYDFDTDSRSLDVYIGYLRRKTEDGGAPRLIHTVRNVGYTARTA
ncbi:winged helix-turn-helix domain-containing protein, partial [Kitasatospora sp. NPDC059803]|uniref:winged helix-turn-helix domain-containing protein n=1 Tax=Kitasatospora sp. NPDC059803 TaxID=3346953 RepID=UPI003664E17F